MHETSSDQGRFRPVIVETGRPATMEGTSQVVTFRSWRTSRHVQTGRKQGKNTKLLQCNKQIHKRRIPKVREFQCKTVHVNLPCDGNVPITCERLEHKHSADIQSHRVCFDHHPHVPTGCFPRGAISGHGEILAGQLCSRTSRGAKRVPCKVPEISLSICCFPARYMQGKLSPEWSL